MLQFLLTGLLATAPFAQDEDPPAPPPSREQVEAAVEAIEAALEAEDRDALAGAIDAARAVPHEDVCEALAEASLAFEFGETAAQALDALGRIEHEDGFERLEKLYKKQRKKLDENVAWGVELFRSIGRTGNPDAVKLLGADSLTGQELRLDRARILALGKVRTVESIETLVSLYNRVRPNEVNKYADQMRTTFAALTGEDVEGGRDGISRWWNDNKRGLELPEEEPTIQNKKLQLVWRQFWGREEGEDGGRGGDDEEGGGGRR